MSVCGTTYRYADLKATVEEHGVKGGMQTNKGCKAYLMALVTTNGQELVVDWERVLPPQAW